MERPAADERRAGTATALLARHEPAFRRTARRYSICADDAEDAFQRAVELLLTRAPAGLGGGRLAAWMQVVTRREALAVRRARERLLAPVPPAEVGGRAEEGVGIDRHPSPRPGPDEHAERRERFEIAAALLAELKPAERLAIVLQACGYSYAEIATASGWTYTKVNRCLAEGRMRLRVLAGGRPAA